MDTSKQCTSCNETKPLSEFHKNKNFKDGHAYWCKVCVKAYAQTPERRAYQAEYRKTPKRKASKKRFNQSAKHKEYQKQYKQREQYKAYTKEYSESEAFKTQQKRYRTSKKGRQTIRAKAARRRAKQSEAGGSFSRKEWINLCRKFDNRCLSCKDKLTPDTLEADHVTPVSQGGTSFINNIQPLCGPCNRSKGNKIIDYRHP